MRKLAVMRVTASVSPTLWEAMRDDELADLSDTVATIMAEAGDRLVAELNRWKAGKSRNGVPLDNHLTISQEEF